MGILDSIFGKKLWATKETTETRAESEFGKRKTTKKEIITEKDSEGNIVSKTTTTEETEQEQ